MFKAVFSTLLIESECSKIWKNESSCSKAKGNEIPNTKTRNENMKLIGMKKAAILVFGENVKPLGEQSLNAGCLIFTGDNYFKILASNSTVLHLKAWEI